MRSVLYSSLNSTTNLRSFKKIHAQLLTHGIVHDNLVLNKVVHFFAKSPNHIHYASDFFKQLQNSFPFNTLISNYALTDNPQASILFYKRITTDGFLPDMYTFPPLIKSCAKFMGIGEIKQVHGVSIKMGFSRDLYIQNSLVHFFSVYGDYSYAWRVFDEMPVRDVVSWTSIISGYVRGRLYDEALALFSRMDVEPNIATLVSILVACGRLIELSMGKGIHALIVKSTGSKNLEASNVLMDMYVKCECLSEAKRIFDELPKRDIVSWTSIISGLVQCKHPKDALELFYEMQLSGLDPDRIILTSVLSACASLGALDYGRWVHEYIDRRGIQWDIHIGTAMVDMYAKCGCIEMALRTFNGISNRNVCTWNALLGGLAMHGLGSEALKHFEEMVRAGTMPNEVTFLAIMTACCHSGLVDVGRRYFYQMSECYNFSPKLEHYGCVIDLLCRAGLLDEALEMTKAMPMPADVSIWGALLSACKANGNTELSREILNNFQELESHDSGIYVLLSNIYATNERWSDVTRIRKLIKEKRIPKNPGSSVIEVDGKAHEFLVGDTSHYQNDDIHMLLEVLTCHVYLEGQPVLSKVTVARH